MNRNGLEGIQEAIDLVKKNNILAIKLVVERPWDNISVKCLMFPVVRRLKSQYACPSECEARGKRMEKQRLQEEKSFIALWFV